MRYKWSIVTPSITRASNVVSPFSSGLPPGPTVQIQFDLNNESELNNLGDVTFCK